MEKFTGFKPEHVGCDVYDIINQKEGEIVKYSENCRFKVVVKFKNGNTQEYTELGLYYDTNKVRRLYFGHNIKVEVTGEEIPEPKLICPVCGVEHGIKTWKGGDYIYGFDVSNEDCPFYPASFTCKKLANGAMENLIKAMK